MQHKFLFAIATVFSVCVSAFPAYSASKVTAEDLENSLSVTTRTNKGLDPAGVQVGSLEVKPSVDTRVQYHDNVYSSKENKVSDFVYVIAPKVQATTNWERHAVSIDTYAESGSYQDTSAEDYLDYGMNLGARYDLSRQTQFPVSMGYRHDHTRRTSPDDRIGNEPTEYDVMNGSAGFSHKGQTIAFGASTNLEQYSYSNTALGTSTINNADRDRTEASTTGRIGMASEGYLVPYTYSTYKKVSYDETVDDNGFDRNSSQVEFGVGSEINLSAITRSDISLGYLKRDMESPQFSDINTLVYKVKVGWDVSTLANLALQGDRTIEETSLQNYAASVDDAIRLSALYEITPFLFLRPRIEYLQKSYEGLDTGELEQFLETISLNYKINRNLWSALSYTNIHQTVGADSPSLAGFDSNIVLLSLKFQM